MSLLRTRNRRSRTGNGKRQLKGPMKASSGNPISSDKYTAVQERKRKARKISSGSSTLICKFGSDKHFKLRLRLYQTSHNRNSFYASGITKYWPGYSDAATPAEQTEQILSIYPIVTGQKVNDSNRIPPHIPQHKSSVLEPTHQIDADNTKPNDDLIDFGQNDDTTAGQSPAAADSSNHSKVGEIQNLLESTQTPPPGGALIDFHEDIKKDLPTIKRSDTEESHDEFHDALG